MVNKKGLSSVVATVLIVLLSLVAVTLLWTFIRGGIEGSSSAVDIANKCLNTEFRPVTCTVNTGAETADVNVRLSRGSADKVVAILENKDAGTTSASVINNNVPANTLSTKDMTFSGFETGFIAVGGNYSVKTAAVFTDSQGGDAYCDPSPVVISCT